MRVTDPHTLRVGDRMRKTWFCRRGKCYVTKVECVGHRQDLGPVQQVREQGVTIDNGLYIWEEWGGTRLYRLEWEKL